MSEKVEVRPIQRKTWHGKKGKESFKRPIKLEALVGDDMQYSSGMTEAERNKYAEILKQDLSVQYTGNPHPFWNSSLATVKLENRTMLFDPAVPIEFVKIRIMKASRFVANSMKEWEEGKWPDATHVIFDEREQIEKDASRIEIIKKAILESAKLSKDRKIQLIMILAGKNVKGKSDNFIEVELNKVLERNPKELIRHMEMSTEKVSCHALVLECLQKSILTKKGHKIFYMDNILGVDEIEVVNYLTSEENQDLRIRLLQAINS